LVSEKSLVLRWLHSAETICDECEGTGMVEADDESSAE
jgi:hypothetical protein